ncbi:MAG: hypothetical protein KKB31_04010, partial [Nanoarchaeota archaeon]|nr:hypothetical protein [Nanoarchaeota archaeon]
HVEIQVGADKLTIESGSPVMVGSDSTDIDGTLVTTDDTYFNDTTKIVFGIVAPDNDADYIIPGEPFMDPIFGTVKIDFAGVYNGPTFTAEQDTARQKVSVLKGGNRELSVSMTDKYGVEQTALPFTYQSVLSDDASEPIHIVEGASMGDEDIFFLNSGNYQHMMRLTKVNLGGDTSDDVWMKDLFSGTVYKVDNKNFDDGQTLTINNQVYTITNDSLTTVTVVSSDYSTNRAVFPYLELFSDKDHRVAYTGNITTLGDSINRTQTGLIYELPTGTVQFNTTNASGWWYKVDSGTWTANTTNVANATTTYEPITVGTVDYVFGVTWTKKTLPTTVVENVSIEAGQTSGGVVRANYPGLLFVEEEDKAETTADTKNFVWMPVDDTGTYANVNSTLLWAGATKYDTQTWDDTDYTGYVTNFGTYVLVDGSDTNNRLASFTYSKNQMYADVYIAEESAAITPGAGGPAVTFNGVVVTDAEVGTVSGKNLIIVGGSCVNSAAATLVGGAYCGSDWTDNTGAGANQWIIKGYATHTLGNKLALLVAGYEQTDTANAATYLTHQAVDTSKEYLGTSATQATMVVDEA